MLTTNVPFAEVYRRFVENATKSPHSVAIIDDVSGREITYGELHNTSSKLASRIADAVEIVYEEPICIMMGRCVEQVVAQLAIIRANGSCVPMDPDLPPQRRDTMLNALRIRCIILHDIEGPHNIRIEVRVADQLPLVCGGPWSPLDQCTHIIHTSGTTGPPKAVQLPAKGLLRHINSKHVKISPLDRVAQICVPFFDISVFDVWLAFLSGATLVVLSDEVIRDARLLRSALERHRVSLTYVPTALFNSISLDLPVAFNTLRTLLVGGEALNVRAVERVLSQAPPSLSLINAYGPTECSAIAISHKVSLEDIQSGRIPIGVAYDVDTSLRVINRLDHDAVESEKGELYLGGDGLARGYLGQPDYTAKKFVIMDGTRWYKTGDQVWWKDGIVGGILEYGGRLDNQVKIRGFRFELEEIDNTILASGLTDAAVTILSKPVGVDPFLVAFVIPRVTDSPKQLKQFLQSCLPPYMVPRIQLCDELPLTTNGKVDRSKLSAQCAAIAETCKAALQGQADSGISMSSLLMQIWREVLVAPKVDLDDDFFELGGNSISAATVLHHFRRASGKEFSISAIYEHRTIRQLSAFLDDNQVDIPSMTDILLADSKLANDFNPSTTDINPNDHSTKLGDVVFLTGATGFLGIYLLAELLKLPDVDVVFCLVQAPSDPVAFTRIEHALQRFMLWESSSPFFGKLRAVAGCLEKSDFGISPDQFQRIAREVKVIYHLGAKVKYTEPYSAHRLANVIGTRNVLRLASSSPPKVLHYASSVAAYGPVGLIHPRGYLLSEDASLHPYVFNMAYDIGYAQSQWVAEELVRKAMNRGLKASIYRPGQIIGDTSRGLGNNEDFVARLAHGCKAMGAWPKLPHQNKLLVPVDYVVAVLLRISMNPLTIGRCYNIVPPEDVQPGPSDIAELRAVLTRRGCDLVELPYREWVERLEKSDGVVKNRLFPLLPMLKPIVHNDLTAWELYENMPTYSTKNTEWALSISPGEPLLYPSMDDEYFGKCFNVWAQA